MKIKVCRVCKNTKLVYIGSLGNIAISNFTEMPSKGLQYSLELVFCQECTLLQLAHTAPRELLYKNYWYQSHINPVIVKDLQEIAVYSKGKRWHIDIGANDGTLLKYSTAKEKLGVEPSKNVNPNKYASWYSRYWEDYDAITPWKLIHSDRTMEHKGVAPADFITAIACIYDLPDPNKFMANVAYHLSKDGLFIAQLMTLEPMIENNDVGNICHEHLEFYSYKSLVRLFEQNGLEIYKVEKNGMNGGSYRIFARHFKKGSIAYKEKEYGVKELRNFFKRIEENKKKMVAFISAHRNIVGYGASTKMNTILQYYGISGSMLHAIVDINPDKVGKVTINSGVPIINKIPHYTEYLWVFPYGFINYFKEKEKEYKGKWITTIPEFKIYET